MMAISPPAKSNSWTMLIGLSVPSPRVLVHRSTRRSRSRGGRRSGIGPGLRLVLLGQQRLEVEAAEQRFLARRGTFGRFLVGGADHALGELAVRLAGLARAVGVGERLAELGSVGRGLEVERHGEVDLSLDRSLEVRLADLRDAHLH